MLGTRKLVVLVCIILFVVSFMGCKGGTPSQKMIGKWKGDVESLKKDPEFDKNPFAKMIIGMLKDMKFEITKETFIVEVWGKTETTKYKIVSETKDSATIEKLEGKEKGKQSLIKIIDNNHIQIQDIGGKSQITLSFERI